VFTVKKFCYSYGKNTKISRLTLAGEKRPEAPAVLGRPTPDRPAAIPLFVFFFCHGCIPSLGRGSSRSSCGLTPPPPPPPHPPPPPPSPPPLLSVACSHLPVLRSEHNTVCVLMWLLLLLL